jgi:hypothetical protein
MKAQLIRSHVGLMPADSPTREWFSKLPMGFAVWIEVKDGKPKRSQQQNSYLWGVVYATILRDGGEALGGWRAEDLHEYLLGEHFGWERVQAFGKTRMRPLRRSSALNKTEFVDYVAFIKQKMAEHGITVPDPDQSEWLADE